MKNFGRIAPRECGHMSIPVIAMSAATEAIQLFVMPRDGLLRYARNDEIPGSMPRNDAAEGWVAISAVEQRPDYH